MLATVAEATSTDHHDKAEHMISLVPLKIIDIPTVTLLPKIKTKTKCC